MSACAWCGGRCYPAGACEDAAEQRHQANEQRAWQGTVSREADGYRRVIAGRPANEYDGSTE